MQSEDSTWNQSARWKLTEKLAENFVHEKSFSAVCFQAYTSGKSSPVIHLGNSSPGSQNGSNNSTLYLVASLTKPVVATAVLCAVCDGLFSLNERISSLLPGWNSGEKRKITVRNLLSHTSGLPDQLPNNLELRNSHASLDQFYEEILKTSLDSAQGTRAIYQSMGFMVLQKLMEETTGMPLREYVRERIFKPLGMSNSYLGLGEEDPVDEILARVAKVEIPDYLQGNSGDWNSRYWQMLGSPWGGMLSTPTDLLKFCAAFFQSKCEAGNSVVSTSMISEASQNQLQHFESMAQRDLKHRGWGLGWRLNWKSHRETFGDLLHKNVIGHWGATGCMMWVDLQNKQACVICSTTPTPKSCENIIRLSNSIHASLVEIESVTG